MDLETTQVDSQATSTTDTSSAVDTSVASTEASQSSDVSTPVEGSQGAQVAPYTPNWKFKVMDKEHEFDPVVRAAIKTKEDEAKVRELYEKAYGLDHVKSERERVKQELSQYKSNWEPVIKDISEANKHYQKAIQLEKQGDTTTAALYLGNTFKHLGIPDSAVKKYVFELLKQEDASPEQKAEYNRRWQVMNQADGANEQVQQLQQQLQQMQVQQRTSELNQVLSKPEIAPIVEQYDQRNGKGAFFEEVRRNAIAIHTIEQRDPTPEEVVSSMIKRYGFTAQPSPAPQAAQAHQDKVPVIPAVKGGGGVSPTDRTIRSVADLRRIAEEKFRN